jgi:hypothetical protein
MATLFQRLRAKQKQDEEKRAARAARAKERKAAGMVQAHVTRQATEDAGLLDLRVEIAVAIEEDAAQPAAAPAPVQHDEAESTVENLVARLTAIRERLFWLQAVWATGLSPDVAMEGDKYRQVFQDLGARLNNKMRTPMSGWSLGMKHSCWLSRHQSSTRSHSRYSDGSN